MTNSDWLSLLKKLSPMIKILPEEVRKPLMAFVLPLLQDASLFFLRFFFILDD